MSEMWKEPQSKCNSHSSYCRHVKITHIQATYITKDKLRYICGRRINFVISYFVPVCKWLKNRTRRHYYAESRCQHKSSHNLVTVLIVAIVTWQRRHIHCICYCGMCENKEPYGYYIPQLAEFLTNIYNHSANKYF